MPIVKLKQAVLPSRQNLLLLCVIRSIIIVGLLSITFGFWLEGTVVLPWMPLLLILSVVAFINVLIFFRLRSDRPVRENEFFANLLLDIVFLTLVLYFTGGSTNPLVSSYLIPLIISAAVLRPSHTWFIAVLNVVLYTVLLFHYQPLDLFSMSAHGPMNNAHLLGMWVNFGFSALLISWFVVRMAATLRQQSRAITRSREAGLRNEQIISIASIAAGAAHEMRTPLATMAVTVDEIAHDHPQLEDEMAMLGQQIERCDAVLHELVATSNEDSRLVVTTLGIMLDSVLEKWSLARPEIKLETDIPGQIAKLRIRYDQSLQYALMSFLNNAADASPQHVRLCAESSQDAVLIVIEDHGLGIPAEIVDSLGKSYISRKQGGLGLGVLLSQASVERLGGEVILSGRQGPGTRLLIRLPVQEITEDD
jgi:two-component system sensor histidine kinase RegB